MRVVDRNCRATSTAASMPPTKKATGKRPATTPVTDDGEAKRLRSVIDETVDEFICALTYELPLDPVTAEDGKIYERAAITEWLKKHKKSPLTNEEMGTKLLPAHQVKNMIEKLVRSGAICGDKAEAWQKRVKEQDELKKLRCNAENGDIDAITRLAFAYRDGELGLAKDHAAAFQWFSRGAEANSCTCMCWVAQYYADPRKLQPRLLGSTPNPAMALFWLTHAAEPDDEDDPVQRLKMALILGCMFTPAEMRSQEVQKMANFMNINLYGIVPNAVIATKHLRRAVRKRDALTGKDLVDWRDDDDEDSKLWRGWMEAAEAWLRDHATVRFIEEVD